MELMAFVLGVVMLLLSFAKTRLRPFAIASTGLLLSIFIMVSSLEEPYPVSGMSGYARGLGDAIVFAAAVIVYAVYLLIMLVAWWRFRKLKKVVPAQQVKRGLLWSIGVVIAGSLISFSNVPRTIKYGIRKRNASAEYKREYDLLSDSISRYPRSYEWYAKRARLGENYFYHNSIYTFGDAAAKADDAKKAYSLNSRDYDFVLGLAYLFKHQYANEGNRGNDDTDRVGESAAGLKNSDDSLARIPVNILSTFFTNRAHSILLDSLNKKVAYYPQQGKWYYQRGILYEEMGDTVNAIADFEKLNIHQPSHEYPIYLGMAEYYLKKGAIDKSNACYRKHIGEYTFKQGAFKYLSERARLKENVSIQAAIDDYKKALLYKPADYTVRQTLHSLCILMQDSVSAKQYIVVRDTVNEAD